MSGDNRASGLMDNYGDRDLEITHGEGMYLYDAAGRHFLDFTAGIAVCSLGHSHPQLTAAIAQQAGQLLHCSNLYRHPQQVALAEKLTKLSGLDRAFFCNTGTEANEAAMKLARRHAWLKGETKRVDIVSLPGAFHGRTFGSLSITPKPAYHQGFEPLLPGCRVASSLASAAQELDEHTAALFVEVIQGEGGVRPLAPSLLRALAERCRAVGALLVVDEVQTGIGRTGSFFAHSPIGIDPDIVTVAKGLAGGLPLGAVLATEDIAAAFTPGSHGSTFGGNPVACAAANVVVDVVADPPFLERVTAVGESLRRLLELHGTEVSGRGLMWGMTRADARRFVTQAASAGVLLTAVAEDRVRFVPPLIASEADVEELERRLASF